MSAVTREKSYEINARLLRHLRQLAAGAEIPHSYVELAGELGVSVNVIAQRISRLRRRSLKLPELPEPPCDCDEVGPCLKHFKPPAGV